MGRQATIWANEGFVYRRTYASLGLDELSATMVNQSDDANIYIVQLPMDWDAWNINNKKSGSRASMCINNKGPVYWRTHASFGLNEAAQSVGAWTWVVQYRWDEIYRTWIRRNPDTGLQIYIYWWHQLCQGRYSLVITVVPEAGIPGMDKQLYPK